MAVGGLPGTPLSASIRLSPLLRTMLLLYQHASSQHRKLARTSRTTDRRPPTRPLTTSTHHKLLDCEQLPTLIFSNDNYRCNYCGKKHSRLELDHVVPRGKGSDRFDNLITACRPCNQKKGNDSIEVFLKDKPELLKKIKDRLERSNLASAAHVNTVLPALIQNLRATGLPLKQADAATVSWNRNKLEVEKTHCYDAALQGTDFNALKALPSRVLQLRPNNGRSKQKANVDGDGTPMGDPFRNQQKVPKHLRKTNPAHSHAGKRQRHGPLLIGTGDTVRYQNKGKRLLGRAVIKDKGTRVAIQTGNKETKVSITHCSLVARNSRWTIRRTAPSQQKHQQDRTSNPAEQSSRADPAKTN